MAHHRYIRLQIVQSRHVRVAGSCQIMPVFPEGTTSDDAFVMMSQAFAPYNPLSLDNCSRLSSRTLIKARGIKEVISHIPKLYPPPPPTHFHIRFHPTPSHLQRQRQRQQTRIRRNAQRRQHNHHIPTRPKLATPQPIRIHLIKELSVTLLPPEEANGQHASTVDGKQRTDAIELGGEDFEDDEGEREL